MTQRVSVAPMMDWTDVHCRYFFRLISPDVRLYTEMVNAQAVIRGDRDYLLGFDPRERPLALQLGGSEPEALADAIRIAASYPYDEINLNVGCPSDRVQSGRFGACLMAEPERVANCLGAMASAADVPVTIKTRIGIDEHDDYDYLAAFVDRVAGHGCDHFIVHARKAILKGLSPKENRSIPPLRYEYVYRLKRDFPGLTVTINGGIASVDEIKNHLTHVDGVMIGRKAYADPFFLAAIQEQVPGIGDDREWRRPERAAIVRKMADYSETQLSRGIKLHHITRHMLGLYSGLPGARRWRRYLSEQGCRRSAGPEVLIDSLALLDAAA
jgi:tRNA-dihydrouridine synthase A